MSCFCSVLGINGAFGLGWVSMNLAIFPSHVNSKDQVLIPHVVSSVDGELLTCFFRVVN